MPGQRAPAPSASSARKPASGSGRAIRKPWAKPQPKPHSAASCAGVSTPSATTSRPSAPADADDRLAERPALRVAVDPADQRAVEPEDVDRQPGQVGQLRGAAAEAVERDVHAHEPQAGDVEAGALVVGHDGRRVDLQDQPLRARGRTRCSACSHVADQRPGREVVERDLEADAQRRLLAVGQPGDGAGGLLERPSAAAHR